MWRWSIWAPGTSSSVELWVRFGPDLISYRVNSVSTIEAVQGIHFLPKKAWTGSGGRPTHGVDIVDIYSMYNEPEGMEL